MFDNKILGQYLRAAREAKGYKQDYVAHRLNVSQNAYSKMELGKSKLTLNNLFALSNILEFDIFEMVNVFRSPSISLVSS